MNYAIVLCEVICSEDIYIYIYIYIHIRMRGYCYLSLYSNTIMIVLCIVHNRIESIMYYNKTDNTI